jgi:hypothetical protein
MKAINVILARDRLDRERKKKEESKRARLESDPHDATLSTFATLAPNAGTPVLGSNVASAMTGETPRHMQFYQAEDASRGSPMSTSMFTPPESSESPTVAGRGSFGNGDAGHFSTVKASSAQATPAQSGFEGVWDRLTTVGMNGSRHGSISSQTAMNTPGWPAVNATQQPTEPRRSSFAETAPQQTCGK